MKSFLVRLRGIARRATSTLHVDTLEACAFRAAIRS